MAKHIVREMIIVLLLALAVILILGVLLYEYVPTNKIIPEKVSYTTPEDVKTELQADSNIEDSQIVFTHQIDATDLNNYKRIQEYVPGRKNPFGTLEQKIVEETENGEGQVSGSSSTSTSSSTTTSSTTSSNSNGYLPDKGTK